MKDTKDIREAERHAMVEHQIASRGVRDDRLLEAMRTVPREAFVGEEAVEFAYEDSALPIEAGQTISQPYIVGLMIEVLEIEPDDRVLEVGAGSGYAAAVVSRMAAQVFAIERHRTLAEAAQRTVDRLGYDNVTVLHGDGTKGWEDEAPFDAILVSAGGADVPVALKEQLALGGRMVMPVGGHGRIQRLKAFHKDPDGAVTERSLGDVRFVPLVSHVDEEGEPEPVTRSAPSVPTTLDRVRRQALSFDSADELDVGGIAERLARHTTVLLGIEDPDDRVGFFGLDLYSLHTSIEAVLEYLEDVDPRTALLARDRFGCLTPFQADPQTYGRLASMGRLEACEDEVVEILHGLLDKRIEYEADDGRRYMDAIENARLVANAERCGGRGLGSQLTPGRCLGHGHGSRRQAQRGTALS